MLKCESIRSQFSAYLDREMPLWKVQLIQWHLKRCPDCAHVVMRLQQTDTILRQLHPVKTADNFLSEVMLQVSTITATEKQQMPLLHRILQRLESSLAWARYSLQTRARSYAVATTLALIMTIASLATLYSPRWLSPPSEDTGLLAPSHRAELVVLVKFEIVSVDGFPKPNLSANRLAPNHTNR